jgi:hypothetical protein
MRLPTVRPDVSSVFQGFSAASGPQDDWYAELRYSVNQPVPLQALQSAGKQGGTTPPFWRRRMNRSRGVRQLYQVLDIEGD